MEDECAKTGIFGPSTLKMVEVFGVLCDKDGRGTGCALEWGLVGGPSSLPFSVGSTIRDSTWASLHRICGGTWQEHLPLQSICVCI